MRIESAGERYKRVTVSSPALTPCWRANDFKWKRPDAPQSVAIDRRDSGRNNAFFWGNFGQAPESAVRLEGLRATAIDIDYFAFGGF